MSKIIFYKLQEDLCILQEYLNNYFSKYLDEKYKIFFIKRKNCLRFMDEIHNYIEEINKIIKEYNIYRNDNFIILLLKDLLKVELKIKKYFINQKKLLFLIKYNRRKYNLKFAKYYKIIDICNLIYLDIIDYYKVKKRKLII